MTVAVASGARPRRRGWWWAAAAGAALAALALLALMGARARGWTRAEEPPPLVSLPDFQLVERSGRPLTLDALRGRPWVADFIFTRCAGVCPAMTARLARLRREIPAEVRFVSFTVDPAHDTPGVLARYAAGFGADDTWLFATGTREALYDLSIGGFKLAAMEVPPGEQSPDGPFLHSSKFALVDAEGAVRGYYDSTDEEAMRALGADARALRRGR
jgi:protein SCO1/2